MSTDCRGQPCVGPFVPSTKTTAFLCGKKPALLFLTVAVSGLDLVVTSSTGCILQAQRALMQENTSTSCYRRGNKSDRRNRENKNPHLLYNKKCAFAFRLIQAIKPRDLVVTRSTCCILQAQRALAQVRVSADCCWQPSVGPFFRRQSWPRPKP